MTRPDTAPTGVLGDEPNPGSDTVADPVPDSPAEQIEQVLAAAAAAAPALAGLAPARRADLLRGAADALDAAVDELVELAMAESHLPKARLTGEVARSSGQLRLFADALDDGAYLEVVRDSADPDAKPVPRPDLRRMLVPTGPVLVFAASNFPFAFSVPGGDTAAALAAGCPVVVKAHPGHPRLSRRVAEVLNTALPAGALGVLYGMEAGSVALQDERITAAAFTGSQAGGRALLDIANARPVPIPFYGELGSLNPVFVTRAALAARGEQIATGYLGSFTMGVGQFCTKPGLLILPADHDLAPTMAAGVRDAAAGEMLSDRIRDAHAAERARLAAQPGVELLGDTGTDTGPDSGTAVSATLLTTTAAQVLADPEAVLQECFGPTSIVVTYRDDAELLALADAFDGQLTASVHAEDADAAGPDSGPVAELVARLAQRAGRVVFNGWPTGVAVAAAMQHGGPWPATTASIHTSVGTTAIRRFLRPVCYQDAPQALLPEALRDDNPLGVPQRVDGTIRT